jgi:muconolactone delta-isomerase
MSTAPARKFRADTLTPLSEHPRWLEANEKVAALEARHARAEARAQAARARLRSQVAVLRVTSTPEDQAQRRARDAAQAEALAAGGELLPLPPALEFDAAQEEMRLLTPLIVEARTERDAVREALDAEASRAMAPELRATYAPLLQALQDLHCARRRWHEVLAKVQAAGYRPNGNVMPMFDLPHADVLGDPDKPQTLAGRLASWFRELL